MKLSLLQHKILETSYLAKKDLIASHLGYVSIIDEIYKVKKLDESFFLGNPTYSGALQIVMDKYNDTAQQNYTINEAVDQAVSDSSKRVWCLINDVEMEYGNTYEALRKAFVYGAKNFKCFLYARDVVADRYSVIHIFRVLDPSGMAFIQPRNYLGIPFLNVNPDGHIMNEEDWSWVTQQEISTI